MRLNKQYINDSLVAGKCHILTHRAGRLITVLPAFFNQTSANVPSSAVHRTKANERPKQQQLLTTLGCEFRLFSLASSKTNAPALDANQLVPEHNEIYADSAEVVLRARYC
jgi:hypothetical protein